MRSYRLIALLSLLGSGVGLSLALPGCDSLWGSFNEGNPQNCVKTPTLCSATEVCNPDTRLCETKCTASTQCTNDPARPLCLNGACVACNHFSEDLTKADAECKTVSMINTHCVATGANQGKCGQCTSASQCANDTYVCSAANQCMQAPCAKNSDCASNVCDAYQQVMGQAGMCVSAKTLVYVDNKNGGACQSGDGSQAMPLCTLAEGLGKVGKNGVTGIRLIGSTKTYGKLGSMASPVTSGTFTIYGPDQGTAPSAQLGGDSADAGVSLGGTANLTIDGVDITGAQIGVSCSASAQLSLRRSQVLGSSDVGILASGCTLLVDRTRIAKNRNGAMELSALPMYQISNNFIVDNSSVLNSAAIRFTDNSSVGKFLYNTVAGNTGPNSAFSCGLVAREIGDSIVVGNLGGTSQFAGMCTLRNTVVGTATGDQGKGGIEKAPVFVDTTSEDYRLQPNSQQNSDCCFGKGQPNPLIKTDFFGTLRKATPDIGAYELK